MGRLIGYARVSTEDQQTAQQRDALKAAGCVEIFEDEGVSGFFVPAAHREGFKKADAVLEAGDTLVVWRLDRLGRSVTDLIVTVADLGDRGIGFKSLTESIDTTTATGKAMFHLFATFAQLYRDQISENTKLAMKAIKEGRRTVKEGKKAIGRPRKLSDQDLRAALMMHAAGAAWAEVAAYFGTTYNTLRVALKRSPAGLEAAFAEGAAAANIALEQAQLDPDADEGVESADGGDEAGDPKSPNPD